MTIEKIINDAWDNKDQVNQDSEKSLKEAIDQVIMDLDTGKSRVCLLYTSPSPRDGRISRMPSSA